MFLHKFWNFRILVVVIINTNIPPTLETLTLTTSKVDDSNGQGNLDNHDPQSVINSGDGVILNSESTLKVLNNYRKTHGVPPLDYDFVLGQNAAKWANRVHDKVILFGRLVPFFSHPHIEGENVFVSKGIESFTDGVAAIKAWYSEIENYDFESNKFSFTTAQFTQLVWKRTRRVGMSIRHDPVRNFTVIVGRFKPPGNVGFDTSFNENVLPPIKEISKQVDTQSSLESLEQNNIKRPPISLPLPDATSTESSTTIVYTSTPTTPRTLAKSFHLGSKTTYINESVMDPKPPMSMSRISDFTLNSNLASNGDNNFDDGHFGYSSQAIDNKNSTEGKGKFMIAKNHGNNVPHTPSKIKVGHGSGEMYFIHSLDDSPYVKGRPFGEIEATKSKRQQKLKNETAEEETVAVSDNKRNFTRLRKEVINDNRNQTKGSIKVNTKNTPHGISTVKVRDGSSEVYFVHHLDDSVYAKGSSGMQENHHLSSKTVSSNERPEFVEEKV